MKSKLFLLLVLMQCPRIAFAQVDSTVKFIKKYYLQNEDNSYHKPISDSIDALFTQALNTFLYTEEKIDIPDSVLWKIIVDHSYGDYEDAPDTRRNQTRVSLGFAMLAMKYPGSGNYSFINYAMFALTPDYLNPDPDLTHHQIIALQFLEILLDSKKEKDYKMTYENNVNRVRAWMKINGERFTKSEKEEIDLLSDGWFNRGK